MIRLGHSIAARSGLFGWLIFSAPACVTVPSGHLGVLLRSEGVAREPMGEGVHLLGPLARAEIYDLRAQEHTEVLAALSADGAMLEARASVLTFRPAAGELVALAREIGPTYYQVIVRPIVRSTVRRVLASRRLDELDTAAVLSAQEEITRIAAARTRPFHVILDGVDLRTLAMLPSSPAYRVVVETSVTEQQVLAARKRVELVGRHTEARREAARGLAWSYTVLAPSLTRETLADSANRAWTRLVTAPSSSVEVQASRSPYLMEVAP
jgi:regulator of protease activity HflC (stomatin/prohibitin superfamily)